MKKLTTLLSLLALSGCMAATGKSDYPDLAAGKADGSLTVETIGELVFGEPVNGSAEPGRMQEWSFALSAPATVTLETSSYNDDSPDTIAYLVSPEIGYEEPLEMDDDGGAGLFSRLTVDLDAGDYRAVVGTYGSSAGEFTLVADCQGEGCGGDVQPADPWAAARDVHTMHVAFTDATPIPEYYTRPEGVSPVSLSSPEWWQRWSGGETQSFSWGVGTDYGKRCGQASAIRLQAIMEYEEMGEDGEMHRPGQEAFDALREGSGWRGTMYNWIEDVSEGGRASFNPAYMWAWRTGAIKWISVTHEDGSCDLPTLDLVQRFSATCLERAASNDGEIQGCRTSGR